MQRIIEEKPFPCSLEDRLASVANAINTELKIATLLHLDDTPREAREIKARIRETIGEGYLPKVNSIEKYGNTLHDVALVARETVVRDTGEVTHVGYSLTEAGKVYGLPAAVISLQYAVDNNISMYQILGTTNSPVENRSPDNRMRILHELRNSEELRETDLNERLGLNLISIKNHLKSLAKIGFATFDSVGAKRKGKFTYEWVLGKSPGEAKTVREMVSLTRRVSEYLAHYDVPVDCHALSEVLEHKHSKIISQILSGLEKQGLVRRTSPWESKEILSKTKILDDGRKYHDEVYLPLVELLLDKLDVSQEKVRIFRSSEQFLDYIRGGIELYRSVSPQINRKSHRERKDEIKNLLRNSQGLTSREISEVLSISAWAAWHYISQLKGVKQRKEGHEVRYFIDD